MSKKLPSLETASHLLRQIDEDADAVRESLRDSKDSLTNRHITAIRFAQEQAVYHAQQLLGSLRVLEALRRDKQE